MTESSEIDYGILAQRAAEERLSILGELLDAEMEDWDAIEARLEPPAQAPYCGCGTCDVRETLVAAWPFLLMAAREEVAGGLG